MKLFTFLLGENEFGIESKYVYRVLDDVRVTPVCLMPPFYLGLLYYRGELFDVADLSLLLACGESFQKSRRIMVIRWANRKLALSTGDIKGLVWIDDQMEKDSPVSEDGRMIQRVEPEEIWVLMHRQLKGPELERSQALPGRRSG